MQLNLAILVAFIVFTSILYPAFAASSYPFVSSWGGQGLTKTGAFTFPQNIAVDESGNVYVTDLGNGRVQKFDNDGVFLHSWGSKGAGKSQFQAPAGIAVRNGYVYVADHELHVVKKFDTAGNFITSWGTEGSDPGKLKLPNGITVSKDNSVYVVDTANNRIQKFDTDGKLIKSFGQSGTGQGQFLFAIGITTDIDGNVYVTDSGNKRVIKFTSDGAFVKSFTASFGGLITTPDGISVDGSGNIFVADTANNRIIVMNKEGTVQTTFGKTGTENGQFKMAKDVAIDSDGDLFVVDSSNHRIQKFGSKDSTQTQSQTEQTTTTVKAVQGDFKKPSVVPPKDLFVEATGGLTQISIGKAIATDESGIKSLTNNAPSEFPLGITTVIWTAIDGSGNVGIATQTVTVDDSTPPVFSNLSDVTIEAKGAQNQVDLGNPTVTDLVGVLTIENDAPESFPLGVTAVTWTATDVAKNVATTIQTVTVTDSTAPKIRAPANVISEASSLDHNEVDLGEPTVSDNSEVSSVTNDAPQFFPLGDTIVTWTAVDSTGNIASDEQTITIVDTTAPIITKPQELTVEATSATANPVTLETPAVTDVQQTTITSDAPQFFPLGKSTISWTAIDPSGNNSTVTQTISIVDTNIPKLIAPPSITQEATGATGNLVTLGEPISEDTTGISSVSNNAPADFAFGTTIVTWTATDNHGNSASANQTVTIIDTTIPNLTAPKDIEVEASSVSENVVLLGEPKFSDLVGIDSITNDAPDSFVLGETVVTWTVTDSSGNSATDTQIISIVDTTPPEIIVPDGITSEATGPSGTSVLIGSATANDAISVESITSDAPESFPLGITTVTWTAKDSSGNISTATQNVTIIDTTVPSIIAPADITQEATSADDNVVSLITPETTDSVSDVTITSDAPETFSLGETTITWTATDEAGNSATATQKVTIIDTTSPSIVAPSDITSEATSKLDNTISLDTPTVTDNVGVATITNDAPQTFPLGITTVTWTATDSSGLTSTVEQKINIVDTTKPELKTSDVTIEATSQDKNSVDLGNIKATDLVEVTSLTNDAPEFFPLGVTTVTWTASDESGNSASITQTVTVEDTVAPTIVTPSDVISEATSEFDNLVSLDNPQTDDAVGIKSISNDAPAKYPLGETIVTWTVTDSSENTSTATQNVTIIDTTVPSIIAPADITQEATSADDNTADLGEAKATDLVSISSVTSDAPDTFSLGETIVTWTATDEAGNSATATQKVTIIDTTSPSIVAPSDITSEATSKLDNTISLDTPTVTDNVQVASITSDAPESFPVGDTIVTWTAKDTTGNTEIVTQKISIVDTTAPKFAKISSITQEATDKDNNQVLLEEPSVSDILDITSISNDAPAKYPLGETIVTWIATDEAGNSATATQKITIVDTTSPQLSIPANIVINAVALDTPVSIGIATATDLTDDLPKITSDAPELFPLGVTTVTWSVQDIFGNTSNQTQTITVEACSKPHSSYNMIVGTEDNDVLVGTTFADLIFGLGGDDIITGENGNDCIFGGNGEDVLYGNDGDDTITGDNDADIIKGQEGDDTLAGAAGTDIVDGGDDDDSCIVTETENDILLKCE